MIIQAVPQQRENQGKILASLTGSRVSTFQRRKAAMQTAQNAILHRLFVE
jgi:hypothetical protein